METNMNLDRIEGRLKQFIGSAMSQWGRLIDDRLEISAGRCVQLSGIVQESNGISRDRAEKLLATRQVSQK
jgi:uncharacterized protein YjbJ (UPF0337 family)